MTNKPNISHALYVASTNASLFELLMESDDFKEVSNTLANVIAVLCDKNQEIKLALEGHTLMGHVKQSKGVGHV